MAFSGDHPVVETILLDVSGSAIALNHSSSIGPNLLAQPAVMVAGYHSSSGGGYQVSLLQLDDAGRLLVSDNSAVAGVTSVTGSVALTEPVTLDRGDSVVNPLFVTGSFTLTIGESAIDPIFVTGSVGVVGPVDAHVTGTVNLDRGNSVVNPLFVTGSFALTQGESALDPLFITGSVGVAGVVSTREVIATAASGTYVLASTTPVTLQAVNLTRRGLLIYNLSNKAMYVKFGTAAGALDFTVKVFSDDVYNVPVLYTGIITAAWPAGATLGAMVTEMTP